MTTAPAATTAATGIQPLASSTANLPELVEETNRVLKEIWQSTEPLRKALNNPCLCLAFIISRRLIFQTPVEGVEKCLESCVKELNAHFKRPCKWDRREIALFEQAEREQKPLAITMLFEMQVLEDQKSPAIEKIAKEAGFILQDTDYCRTCSFSAKRHKPTSSPLAPIQFVSDGKTLTTHRITSVEQIRGLVSINGLSVADIEKRARPAQFGPRGNEGISDSGFLGINESFQDVLLADWDTVQTLGWTHEQLAFHLDVMWTRTPDAKSCMLTHRASDKYPAQKLLLKFISYRSAQSDLFDPKETGWSEECSIKNLSTGAEVICTPGGVYHIKDYGFYEGGGRGNKYRVDPVALISILTGEKMESLQAKLGGSKSSTAASGSATTAAVASQTSL